jgi:hypothetical protein
VRTHAARVVHMTAGILPGPYRIPAYRAVGHFRLTNKTPAATYRAPGRFEGTFVRERLFDAIADRLGLDRVMVRRRNLITETEMPFSRPLNALGTEIVYDSGDFPRLLDKALAKIGWDSLQAELQRRRAAGELVGSGIAIFGEKGGLGPLDGARVTVDGTGAVELVTGGWAVGQGFATAMAQICAGTIGVDYRRVRVVSGQTDRIQYGIGAHASRASVMTGSATHTAALKVRATRVEMAGPLLDDRTRDCHHLGIEVALGAAQLWCPNIACRAQCEQRHPGNGSLHIDHAYVGANMIGIGPHAQGVRSRADSLAFVPGTAYENRRRRIGNRAVYQILEVIFPRRQPQDCVHRGVRDRGRTMLVPEDSAASRSTGEFARRWR